MAKEIQLIGLDELELEKNDMVVRKNVDSFDVNARVVVADTHSAILIKDGRMQETLSGGSYPLFDKKRGLFGDKKIGNFTVSLIYLSKTAELQVFWGTPIPFDFRDSETGVALRVGASGEFGVIIENPRQFYLKVIGVDAHYTTANLSSRLRSRLLAEIEPAIATTMSENNLPYWRIAEYKKRIADEVYPTLKEMFLRDYGLNMSYFTIQNIAVNDEDKQLVEAEIAARKQRQEEEVSVARERELRKEQFDEEEERKARQFEREKFMREADARDYELRMRVTHDIGWESATTTYSRGAFCPNCGAQYSPGDKFCGKCGNKVGNSSVKCPDCGAENPSSAAFCSSCGKKL